MYDILIWEILREISFKRTRISYDSIQLVQEYANNRSRAWLKEGKKNELINWVDLVEKLELVAFVNFSPASYKQGSALAQNLKFILCQKQVC